MKAILNFGLEKPEIPADYRPFLLSFFKKSLSEHNPQLFEKYYSEKYGLKNFCFSTYLKDAEFHGDRITVNGEISITLSVLDFADLVDWYNAFLKMKNCKFPLPMGNHLMLKSVKLENHKEIKNDTILVKMLSPIAVRVVEGKKSNYLSFDDENFIPRLKDISLNMLESLTNVEKDKIPLEIEAVKPNKTVTYAMRGNRISANLGIYKIHSDPYFLNHLYVLGIGSRRSEGFGMFEIIE